LGGIAQDEDDHDSAAGDCDAGHVKTRLGTLNFFDGFPDKRPSKNL